VEVVRGIWGAGPNGAACPSPCCAMAPGKAGRAVTQFTQVTAMPQDPASARGDGIYGTACHGIDGTAYHGIGGTA
jgi:hypothetical protein